MHVMAGRENRERARFGSEFSQVFALFLFSSRVQLEIASSETAALSCQIEHHMLET